MKARVLPVQRGFLFKGCVLNFVFRASVHESRISYFVQHNAWPNHALV